MENFLFQATMYLGAAVIAVPLAARLSLGSVLVILVRVSLSAQFLALSEQRRKTSSISPNLAL